MILYVVQAPDPVLAAIAQPIKKLDKQTLTLIEDMKETLVAQKDPEGIGLAAPQVGASVQIFIIKPEKESPFDVFINPQIDLVWPKVLQKSQGEKDKSERKKLEGCLSLKVIWGEVQRAPKVHATWMDEKGATHKATFSGFYATIMQHEYDHLQGILFPRRVLEQKGQLYKSSKDENGHDVFDPVEI